MVEDRRRPSARLKFQCALGLVDEALSRALAHDGLSMVEVMTDPDLV